MLWFLVALAVGLVVLVWSADRFVDGAAATAAHFGLPPLLIGMVIVGFGTSAPELVVSVLAASSGNPGLALGNAYGSNIGNIALILGITALVSPIPVRAQVVRQELPLLLLVTLLAVWQLWDGQLSRVDGWLLLLAFTAIMGWTIKRGLAGRGDPALVGAVEGNPLPLRRALFYLGMGLVLLVLSSRVLVWGAVNIAMVLGVSDLVVGLTIVAVGTSLPELASSLVAARKGAHEMALGNVIGSNLFNTLAVVGLAVTIQPLAVSREVLVRDALVMTSLTVALLIMGYGFKRAGRIGRLKGGALLAAYVAYLGWLIFTTLGSAAVV